MSEFPQNKPKKWVVILKAVLIPCLAYAAWQAINYIVQYTAIFIFSFYAVRKNPGAGEAELNQIVFETFYRNISLLYITAALLLALVLYLVNRKLRFTRMIDIHTRKLGGALSVAAFAIGTFVGVSANTILNMISEKLPQQWVEENQESVNAFDGGNLFISLLATVIAAPVIEELLFRGFLYNALKKIMNTLPSRISAASHRLAVLTSALITSALFGIYHGNILQALYAGLLSFIMIWLYELTGSLLSNMLFHAAFNFSAFAMNLMVNLYGVKTTAVLSTGIALILMTATGIACKRKNHIDLNT
ncbi:MAG: lysostaphin resistance A-like protein [Clostridia bacterium]